MKPWIKVVGAALVLLIAGVVSVIALVKQYDYNNLKPTIAQMVKDATGRDLVIRGDLNLAVSLSPTLEVFDITFANAPWSKADGSEAGDMVSLKQLDAKVDLVALLQGRVDVDYVVLEGLTVVLQTDGKGRANWEFEAPGVVDAAAMSSESLMLAPSVRDVRLKDVDVTYIDGATGKRLHLVLQRADFKADSVVEPMHGVLAATYQGLEMDAVVEMGSFSHLVGNTGGQFPVSIEMSAPGLNATLKGGVDQPQAGLKVNVDVNLSVSDGATLATLAGVELPNVDGLTAAAKIQGGGDRYGFNAIDVRVGGSDLGGDVVVTLAGQRPRVTGKLTSKVLDLGQMFGIEEIKTTPGGSEEKMFDATPLPLDVLEIMDAELDVQAGQIKLASLAFNTVQARVKLDGGKLDVAPLSLIFEEGDINGALHVDSQTLKITSTAKGLDIGRVLKAFGKDEIMSLAVNGKINVSSTGDSMHQWMRNMNGSVQFSGRDGRLNHDTVNSLAQNLTVMLPWVQHKDASVISCMVANWPIKVGEATAETVLMDTPGFSVAVTGNVDLGGELLHLTIIPRAKSSGLTSFAVPVRVKGALSAPYMDVDPGDALKGTVGNIFMVPGNLFGDLLGIAGQNNGAANANDPCFKALSGGNSKPTQAPPLQQQPQQQLRPTTPAENLGKALEGLLGR
ncbi:MAG: AsmA family protein [Rhodospirillales bacterium]|nr:AsmA family protein [Rhodospirillales bacterium]